MQNLNTSVVLKFNSFNPLIQDKLAGVSRYDGRVRRALNNLISAGFNKSNPPRMAIDCIVTSENKKDVFDVFKFCRENNISPQISGLIPHGEALERGLVLSREEYMKIYNKARFYDISIGLEYDSNPPFLGGFECKQIKYGLYGDIIGDVWECNAGELLLGNIRQKSLKNMWTSEESSSFRKSWVSGSCHIREKYWNQNDKK